MSPLVELEMTIWATCSGSMVPRPGSGVKLPWWRAIQLALPRRSARRRPGMSQVDGIGVGAQPGRAEHLFATCVGRRRA
jgi:hypothetical protein